MKPPIIYSLVLCVLAKLKEPVYGYSLMTDLANTGVIIEANTLYPLLRRLEEQRLLKSEWNTNAAKPRKYYSVTPFGAQLLDELKDIWKTTVKNMDRILE